MECVRRRPRVASWPPPLVLVLLLSPLLVGALGDSGASSEDPARSSGVKVLRVGRALNNESLPYEGGSCVYELHDLRASRSYEVKVSYPASVPASFTLQLQEGGVGFSRASKGSRRRILDTEKLTFLTNEDGQVEGHGLQSIVTITVQPAGIFSGRTPPALVYYNLDCEELRMGVPLRAWRVAGYALGCIALVIPIVQVVPSVWASRRRYRQWVMSHSRARPHRTPPP